MARIKLNPQTAEVFYLYLQTCITLKPHTNDAVKEYTLARLVQKVIYKIDHMQLKYKEASTYKIKSIQFTELQLLAINIYMTRYEFHIYLMPLQQEINETIRRHYPQLVNLLSNNIQWKNFLNS